MTDERWRNEIYEPYLETYKILKLIQHGYKHLNNSKEDFKNDEAWAMFTREAHRLENAYPGNPFVEQLSALVLNAGETIAQMNQEEPMIDWRVGE